MLTTYNANKLAADSYTGKGTTIVFFAFDGFEQADLDTFATTYRLPKFTPTVVGGQPGEARGETTMDLEVAHAVAPDAQKVVVNARPTVEGDGGYEKIGRMLEDADRQFPGAVWSFSIGWGCDKLITAADMAPVRSALATAHSHGTTAFNASGDLAGLECKGGEDWSSPPGANDVGLDSVASLPEMVDVGGTTLSTDANGVWQAEQAWFDVPLSQGTGGGVSSLFDRPEWQRGVLSDKDPTRRLTPDVAAVADPFTGVRIVFNQQQLVGGGTSQSAPIWAGLAAVMNQYLLANGGQALGDLNPMLYRIAAGAPLPGFRDVTLGGNAVDTAGPATTWSPGSAHPTSTTWCTICSSSRRRCDEHERRASPHRGMPNLPDGCPGGRVLRAVRMPPHPPDAGKAPTGCASATSAPRRANTCCSRRWPAHCSRTCRRGHAPYSGSGSRWCS